MYFDLCQCLIISDIVAYFYEEDSFSLGLFVSVLEDNLLDLILIAFKVVLDDSSYVFKFSFLDDIDSLQFQG